MHILPPQGSLRPNIKKTGVFQDISDMAGKCECCMIFLPVVVHKGCLKLASQQPDQSSGAGSGAGSGEPFIFVLSILLDIYGNPTTLGCQMDD
jgi:hypothetical protein